MVAKKQESPTKQHILDVLETLPEESLAEIAAFVDFQRYKVVQRPKRETPYRPVPLGGLWKDEQITDEDIAEVRREMWENFGDRDF